MSPLTLEDVIHRSVILTPSNNNVPPDIKPLIEYLKMDGTKLDFSKGKSRCTAELIAKHFREMGSNDIATLFRGDGVSYSEIVVDVGNKLNAKNISEDNTVEKNEEAILWKIFADTLDRMTDNEKRELLRSMGITESDIPVGSITTIAVQQILRQYGGFYLYELAVIVANFVSRALLGQGLTLAANVALTRTIGSFLGPIGWIATGLWLLFDLTGPAYRKTVPAVIHVAMLRQLVTNRITVGVVGDGSSGKDSLMHSVFGLDSQINPVAGSTKEAMVYPLNSYGNAFIVNYPGFNDYRTSVNQHTDDFLYHTDVFVLVVDISRGISGKEVEILEGIKKFGKPILICLNKVDLPRSANDKASLRETAEERLRGCPIIETAFDPDPRISETKIGCRATYNWILGAIKTAGKSTDSIAPFYDR